MRPLTETTPKPLISVLGAPILDHLLRALPTSVERIVITVDYLAAQFEERYGASSGGREFVYIDGSVQGNAKGFLAAESHVRGERLLVAYADDLPSSSDVSRCLAQEESILCFNVDDSRPHGMAVLRPDGTIGGIMEKPDHYPSNLAVNGLMVLKREIFSVAPEMTAGEYHFSAMLNRYTQGAAVRPVIAEGLIWGISTPADLPRVEAALKKRYAV